MVHVLHNSEQMASCIAVLDTGTCVTADSSFDLLMQKMRHFYAVRKNLRVESRGQRYQLVDFVVKIGSVVLGQTTSFKGVLIEVTYYQPVDSLCRAFCSLCWVYVCVKGKGSPYSITERRVPELIRFLAVSLQMTWVINPAVGCHYFPPGPQLPSQPLRVLLPISLLGEQRHDGCEQFAYDCYLTASRLQFEPGPSVPESSTLTTRLPSHPRE